MCGIAGAINFPLNIPQLTKDLLHRGPDAQNTYRHDNVILHHHRLSIVDIAGGVQPMHHEHLTIIFNGEIYNHKELRSKYGLICKTGSDTETILLLFLKLGPACLNDFDGMFAFVIHDRKKDQLFAARDRAGKKPFYYFSDGKQFIFASELNALRHQLDLEIDHAHIAEYIKAGWFYGSHTPYKNVFELPPACYLETDIRNPVPLVVRWWTIGKFYKSSSKTSFEEALSQTESLLHTAIKRRVESSDLEVGSFLSGGIDSGIVTAIAKEYNSKLKTFTVSFDGEYDEAPLAKQVASKYETDHHEIKISYQHLENDVERILFNYGEPFYDDSAIPSYYVSLEAKKHLTVILNGDGGDELFGGYRRYVPFSKIDFFKKSSLREFSFKMINGILPDNSSRMGRLNYLKRMLALGSVSGRDTYLRATTDIFEGFEKKAFLQDYLPSEDIDNSFFDFIHSDLSGLQKIMLLDFENILPAILLVKMDIATMAHSLEGRSPLLGKELMEYIPTLPDDFKIKGIETKYLLRKLSEKYLPHTLVKQPKRGFEPPLKQWVDGQLKQIISDYLLSGNNLYPGFISKQFVVDLLDNKAEVPGEKRAKILWLLFTLEVWYRKVYNKAA